MTAIIYLVLILLCNLIVKIYVFQACATYFLCQADPLITLVALFDSQKSEKDNYIRDFVHDLAHQLRCIKIFTNLKPK